MIALPSLPSPVSTPIVWDAIYVQGIPWQGRIVIRGAKRSYKWDHKKGDGVEGVTPTYKGKQTRPFQITFFLWTDAHFANWPAFQALFEYAPPQTPAIAYSISHPSLSQLGIDSVVTHHIGAIEMVSDDLLWCVTVELEEFIPTKPVPVTTTPKGSLAVPTTTIVGATPDPALEALRARAEALSQQAAAETSLPP